MPGGAGLRSSRTKGPALARRAVRVLVAYRRTVAVQLVGSVVFYLPKLLVRLARIVTAPTCQLAAVWFRAETGTTSLVPWAGCRFAVVA